MERKSLIIGVLFFIASAYCGFSLLTKGFESYSLSGLVLFALIGLAFVRRARSR